MNKNAQEALERLIPGYMQGGVKRFIDDGVPAGGFLMAVFENDLMEALGQADDCNGQAIGDYCKFLYNYAPAYPMKCYGSKENVAKWIKIGGLNGLQAKLAEGPEHLKKAAG